MALRIVHAIRWPDPPLGLPGGLCMNRWDPKVESAGACVLEEAADLARSVAPTVPITTHLQLGDIAQVVLREGRHDALIVLGRRAGRHRRGVAMSVSSQVACRSSCPVRVVDLLDEVPPGPSLGRVVVSTDGTQDPTAALGFAFRAARHRDVGITAILAWSRRSSAHCDVRVAEALRVCREAFPDVEVRERVVAPAGWVGPGEGISWGRTGRTRFADPWPAAPGALRVCGIRLGLRPQSGCSWQECLLLSARECQGFNQGLPLAQSDAQRVRMTCVKKKEGRGKLL